MRQVDWGWGTYVRYARWASSGELREDRSDASRVDRGASRRSVTKPLDERSKSRRDAARRGAAKISEKTRWVRNVSSANLGRRGVNINLRQVRMEFVTGNCCEDIRTETRWEEAGNSQGCFAPLRVVARVLQGGC